VSARAALITGGSGGIGLAIARVLAEEGYGVTLSAHLREEVDAAVRLLRAKGLKARGIVADVAEEQDVIEMVAAHHRTWGRLDALVNSAGISIWQPLERIETVHIDRLLAVNLRGAMLVTREALPLLRAAGAEHGKALIVNVSSITGGAGRPNLSIYAATKAGLTNFTQSTQRTFGREGVQCTALAPGFVDTPMTDPIKRNVSVEHLIQPGDVGEAVRFLLHTSANCHVSEITLARPSAAPHSP
jgi:NAD(P)-dependent dehydrogenase (short-subunit alcohol dehydrogenase family)